MVEDDTFTYHVKQQRREPPADTAVHSLITKERTQKLDLLIHLLSNLSQSLVVCGPEGIGKTMLLTMLQERKTDLWQYCSLQGNADLSFEAIQNQLAKSISQDKSVQSLSMALARYEGRHKQVVLIVDNAGELVPGLITAIIQYAAANPVLKVIFALTHDELQVKRGSDRAVDNCHIVEIPTLSEKQCGDFLRLLSLKPAANLSLKAISDNMIAHIYRETHGVPGRIISELPGLSDVKQEGKLKWTVVVPAVAVAAVAAIAWGIQWLAPSVLAPAGINLPSIAVGNTAKSSGAVMLPLKNKDEKVAAPAFVEPIANNGETAPVRPESQIMLALPPAQPVTSGGAEMPINQQYAVKDALAPPVEVKNGPDRQQSFTPMPLGSEQKKPEPPVLDDSAMNDSGAPGVKNQAIKAQVELADSTEIGRKPANKGPDVTPVKTAERLEINKKINSNEALTAGKQQIMQPPQKPVEAAATAQQAESEELLASTFTLQLMVLSKQESVDAILNKYPSIKSGIRVINALANGQQKFILEYGSYPDSASANKARQSLPPEFRKALVRKTSSTKHR